MKTTPCFTADLPFALFVARLFAGTDVIADWNVELDDVQRSSQQLPSGRIRADAIMKAILVSVQTGLEADGHSSKPPSAGANLEAAAAHAAYTGMAVLYSSEKSILDACLAESLAAIDDTPAAMTAGEDWGQHVAQVILAEQGDSVTLNAYNFATADQSPASSTPGQTQADSVTPGRYRSTVLAGTQGLGGTVVVTDGRGRATSRTATIAVVEDRVQTTNSVSTGSTSAAGGGDFGQWFTFPVLALLEGGRTPPPRAYGREAFPGLSRCSLRSLIDAAGRPANQR